MQFETYKLKNKVVKTQRLKSFLTQLNIQIITSSFSYLGLDDVERHNNLHVTQVMIISQMKNT
jgi:hypothetical protein